MAQQVKVLDSLSEDQSLDPAALPHSFQLSVTPL